MKKLYCSFCDEERECNLKEELIEEIIDNKKIKYMHKSYICETCKNEVFDDEIFDYNIKCANEELRKQTGLITISEINEILDKYSISQKNLSLVLGFGEIQISRYLKSGNPNKEHSDILKSIYNSPFIFEMYLNNSKDLIQEKSYKKALSKVRQIELSNEHSKLYNVGTYIIDNLGFMDNMSLQKILYFLYGFSTFFLGNPLFNDLPEAWIHGPVYAELYDAFAPFTRDAIESSELIKDVDYNLSEEEKEYINNVSVLFSCYGGTTLRNMSHLTDPWVIARESLSEEEYSHRIIDSKDITNYFNKVIEEYKIKNYKDIKKYSEDLFKKVTK